MLFFVYLSPEKEKKMAFLKDVFDLFYPKLCAVCKSQLITTEIVLCVHCRHDLPIVDVQDYRDNKISQSFYGRIPIEKAMSFLYYRKEGKAKTLIHQLKYKGNQEIGAFFGDWFGDNLKQSGEFSEVDCIVPVPLHPKKMKQRGFNQLTTFGERLSTLLEVPYQKGILIKTTTTKTQTFKQRFERFSDSDTKFSVTDLQVFQNKHILLIDDVITTGATLEACCKELLKAEGVKISIVTIAFTE